MAAEQRTAPAEQGAEPVAEPGQKDKVHSQPHHPAGEAAQADALELDHGPEPTDRRHAPEVDVLEGHGLVAAALQPAPDRAPGEETLLHGDPATPGRSSRLIM